MRESSLRCKCKSSSSLWSCAQCIVCLEINANCLGHEFNNNIIFDVAPKQWIPTPMHGSWVWDLSNLLFIWHDWINQLQSMSQKNELIIALLTKKFHRVIQAPRKIGGLSYNPSTSAFHVYKKDHDVFMSHQSQQEISSSPITAEDEEVAAILANALPPGEYIRRHFGH